MTPENLSKIAASLYLEDNFWGDYYKKDESTRLHYLDMARRIVELIEKCGFTIEEAGGNGERSTSPQRGGGTSGQG